MKFARALHREAVATGLFQRASANVQLLCAILYLDDGVQGIDDLWEAVHHNTINNLLEELRGASK